MSLNCCTYHQTGAVKTLQFYRTCFSCFSRPNLGACLNCISVCHDGHDVGPLQIGEIFCACGNHKLCKYDNFIKDGVIVDKPKANKKQKLATLDSLDMLGGFDDNPMLFDQLDEDEDFLQEDAKAAPASNKKNGRAKKDPNAPKGPLSSFMVYSIEARSVLHKENPSLTMIELSRLIGDNWKNMDASQREEFELRGKADRERYAAEMAEYKNKIELGLINPVVDISAAKGSSSQKGKNVGTNGKRAYNRKAPL